MAVDVQQITGTARSVQELLLGTRYGLDFYQREYSWEEAQVGELIDDLTVGSSMSTTRLTNEATWTPTVRTS